MHSTNTLFVSFLLYVWITQNFFSNGCGVSMARIYKSRIGQDEQLCPYRTNELSIVPIKKVGTTNPPLKQRVTREQQSTIRDIKAHATCRMTRCGYAPQHLSTYMKHITIVQRIPNRSRHIIRLYTETRYRVHEIINPWLIIKTSANPYPIGIFNECRTKNMIKMQVCA